MAGHKGKEIAAIIFSFLEKKEVSISNCRGQSYDNASNMSGKYIGVQNLVKNRCIYAEYCPCFGHSLNLVGQCTVENCPASFSLFSFIQKVYVFYAASTHRWQKQCEMLRKKDTRLVVKRLSETGRSARADAVKALSSEYTGHIELLTEFSNNTEETLECRRDTSGILVQLKKLDTSVMLVMWDTLLERIQKTSEALQKTRLALNTAIQLLKSLISFIKDMREQYDETEEKAMEKCPANKYHQELRRTRKTPRFLDDDDDGGSDVGSDTALSAKEYFRINSYLPVIDSPVTGINLRLEAYQLLSLRFGFLSNILQMSDKNLRQSAVYLNGCYPDDLEGSFSSEIVQFAAMMKNIVPTVKDKYSCSSELMFYRILHENDMVALYPNVEIALRIYFCMFVTNCTGERSFSKLKLILNHLRNTMGAFILLVSSLYRKRNSSHTRLH